MNPKTTIITKASGETTPFSEEKFKTSLRRSGASSDIIDDITKEVTSNLYKGISTKKIHRLAYGMLKKKLKPFAAKYKLKAAIMELGPTGFPFERYIAAILHYNGYAVTMDEAVQGVCVKHEIDVIAKKNEEIFMVECKYHNAPGIVCDVKIPLYIKARFLDIENVSDKMNGTQIKFHQGWVVTNTKFSSDAIQYGECSGLHLIGWNYPFEKSLNKLIENSGLYPLTCLTTLSKNEKQNLLDNNIVNCREISENPGLLRFAGIGEPRLGRVLSECNLLSGNITK
jgi:hypothetical protein